MLFETSKDREIQLTDYFTTYIYMKIINFISLEEMTQKPKPLQCANV